MASREKHSSETPYAELSCKSTCGQVIVGVGRGGDPSSWGSGAEPLDQSPRRKQIRDPSKRVCRSSHTESELVSWIRAQECARVEMMHRSGAQSPGRIQSLGRVQRV